ncbi:MAG: hypothetical protein LBJ69_01920 [Holosporales bacterium]|jgi:hypothetical protein|nr:hypothetical protein [Holosporales bacterium]
MSPEVVLYSVAAISGMVIAVQDVMSGKVGLIPLLCFLTACMAIACFRRECHLGLVLILTIVGGSLFLVKRSHALGLADYVVGSALSVILQDSHLCTFLIICGALGIAAHIILSSNKIPFTPIMLLAYVVTNIVM